MAETALVILCCGLWGIAGWIRGKEEREELSRVDRQW